MTQLTPASFSAGGWKQKIRFVLAQLPWKLRCVVCCVLCACLTAVKSWYIFHQVETITTSRYLSNVVLLHIWLLYEKRLFSLHSRCFSYKMPTVRAVSSRKRGKHWQVLFCSMLCQWHLIAGSYIHWTLRRLYWQCVSCQSKMVKAFTCDVGMC